MVQWVDGPPPADVPPPDYDEEEPTLERDTWRRKKKGQRDPRDLLAEARELFDAGEHTRSLELCRELEPILEDDEELLDLLRQNEEILASSLLAQVGGPDAVPSVTVDAEQVAQLALDHREAFLLTRIDGMLTVDEVLVISGMSRYEAAQCLLTLVQEGLVTVLPPEEDGT